MLEKSFRLVRNFFKEEKGITGLETAIILIAFVTVASVLAYSVLSAGIFSAERGKETVYRGLQTAQSTLQMKGSVLGMTDNQSQLDDVQFDIALTMADEKVDTSTIVFNYFDDDVHYEGLTANISLSTGSTERGAANMIEGDEVHTVSVSLPETSNVTAYKSFTIQMIPPSGATITLKRTLPGTLLTVMDLH